MRVIGLTGGIASGKNLVASVLEKLGAVIIDADQLARDVVAPGEQAYFAIVGMFGKGILNPDGTLDRKALGKIVFADAEARCHLEGITHPAIAERAGQILARLREKGTPVAVYMAPLLIEAGVTSRVDEIWVVHTNQEIQVARLMARDRISRADALQRIAAQMPISEKMKYGKVLIDNSGTPEETERLVKDIWAREIAGSKV